jgi:hypothetical protein
VNHHHEARHFPLTVENLERIVIRGGRGLTASALRRFALTMPEQRIAPFVNHFNTKRYHESLNNLTTYSDRSFGGATKKVHPA